MSAPPPDVEMHWLPTSATPLTEAALAYASHGLRVLSVWGVRSSGENVHCGCGRLCDAAGKHPIGGAWQKRATSDVDAVRDARRAHPDANVGLAMGGAERLIAVDIDGEAGRASWGRLQTSCGPAPRTLTSRSGRVDGGEHLVFRVPAHLDVRRIKNRAGLLPGIDTRGDNGQIVAPPSLHRSGARYEFVVRAPIAELPDRLFEALAAPALEETPTTAPRNPVVRVADAYVAKVISNAARDIAGAAHGQRNALLFAKSATAFEYCIGEAVDQEEAWRALTQAGLACGLGRREVETTLGKAWKAALDSPRRAPEPRGARESRPGSEGRSSECRSSESPVDLVRNTDGGIKNTFGNVCKILRGAPEYRGHLSFHEMRVSPMLHGAALRDADVGRVREHIEATWMFSPSQETTIQAIQTVAAEQSFHPVRRYLSGLTWDGEPRIVRIATHVFGVDRPDLLQQRILRRWFISAVARALQPGSKVDTALVLVGPQGYRKSSFFATLGGEWFNDSHMDITTKDGILQLHAAWIYEWAEIEHVTSKKQAAEVKAFITCATDAVRPPFARAVVNQPRSGVIVGTTNEEQFLDDPTGSRRFWIVRIERPIAIETLAEWRDQLWAEAVAAHAAGETWWLDAEDEAAREKSADRHRIDDPWEEPIRAWLDQLLADPGNRGSDITIHTLLTKALHLDTVHQHANAMARAGKCMRRLGYTSERKSVGAGNAVRVWRKSA